MTATQSTSGHEHESKSTHETAKETPARKIEPKLVYDVVTYHCGCFACIGHGLPGQDGREKTEELDAEKADLTAAKFASQLPQPPPVAAAENKKTEGHAEHKPEGHDAGSKK